jgi:uncharacterized membrane protein
VLSSWLFTEIGICFLSFILVISIVFVGYLLVTKAFKEMGFTSGEAFMLVFASFIFGFSIFDIYLFTYNNWNIGLNIGGALIPILLSVYLTVKKKISLLKIVVGTTAVAIVTYLVTFPDPQKGIVSPFPFWLLPAVVAGFISAVISYKNYRKASPLAYISGVLGVLIGADVLHLWEFLSYPTPGIETAVVGGASVFDMIFITGILAVIVDGLLMIRQRRREKQDSYIEYQ